MAERCSVCGNDAHEAERFVLVRGRRRLVHCSANCLLMTVRARQSARRAAQARWALRVGVSVLALAGAAAIWLRVRVPKPEAISVAWADGRADDEAHAGPILIGPPWPPTDEQWTALLNQASWVHPLPGPERREAIADEKLFAAEQPRELPASCRRDGVCGVDLGGELWGEHVYAALDGVVERVGGDGPNHPGGIYVRLSHFGGIVFTQYFHLAATPRGIHRGAHVRAGEVIGLVGDTGLPDGQRHLHLTLSVRPSRAYPEVFWDPTPWLARARLLVPPHGSVAGYVAERDRADLPRVLLK